MIRARLPPPSQAALARFGRIDVLVNNAGHGLLGAVEEASDAEIADVFEINVFGLMRVTQAVLAHFRARRSGHVVNFSSIGGLIGISGYGIYNSTKFAVEGLSEALAKGVAPSGIRVTIVEPGPFRTNFLGGSLVMTGKTLSDYDQTAGRTRAGGWNETETNRVIPFSPRKQLLKRSRRKIRHCTCSSANSPTKPPRPNSTICAKTSKLGARCRFQAISLKTLKA